MQQSNGKGRFCERFESHLKRHPLKSAFWLILVFWILIPIAVNAIILVWRFRRDLLDKVVSLFLVFLVASVPMIPSAIYAQDLGSSSTDIYAAVFVVPDAPPSLLGPSEQAVPNVTYGIVSTNGSVVPWVKNLSLALPQADFDYNALSNALKQAYGVTLARSAGPSRIWSSFGVNGSSTNDIPFISIDPNTHEVIISNNIASSHRIVCLRGSDLGDRSGWTPVLSAVIPEGYQIEFSDGNAPAGNAFYQVKLTDEIPTAYSAVSSRQLTDAHPNVAVECAIAVVIIVVGTVVTVKLYYLCKRVFPPPHQEHTNNATSSKSSLVTQ